MNDGDGGSCLTDVIFSGLLSPTLTSPRGVTLLKFISRSQSTSCAVSDRMNGGVHQGEVSWKGKCNN